MMFRFSTSKKKLRIMIKGTIADCIVGAYLLGTLFLRFMVEGSIRTHPILSIALGLVMLLLLWAMIKVRFLQPNYFGLLGKKEDKAHEPDNDDNPLFV